MGNCIIIIIIVFFTSDFKNTVNKYSVLRYKQIKNEERGRVLFKTNCTNVLFLTIINIQSNT